MACPQERRAVCAPATRVCHLRAQVSGFLLVRSHATFEFIWGVGGRALDRWTMMMMMLDQATTTCQPHTPLSQYTPHTHRARGGQAYVGRREGMLLCRAGSGKVSARGKGGIEGRRKLLVLDAAAAFTMEHRRCHTNEKGRTAPSIALRVYPGSAISPISSPIPLRAGNERGHLLYPMHALLG